MLEAFLVGQLFAFLIVFCRIGGAAMLLPGIGEAYVSPRIRLLFALGVSLIVTPLVEKSLPGIPATPFGLGVLMLAEIGTGVFFGLISRIIISTMHMAGMVIAFQSSLSTATLFDATQSSQGSAIGNFLSMTAVVLIFALDLHHLMLRGLVDTYSLFIPGAALPLGDMAKLATNVMGSAFEVAIKLSAPHIVVGLMIYLAAGILSRLMPALQVFFLLMAPQILISFFILMAMVSTMLVWYMAYFEESLQSFLAPGT